MIASNDRQWSKKVKERDNYVCQACGNKFAMKDVEAHHILSWYAIHTIVGTYVTTEGCRYPELAELYDLGFVVENGVTLCTRCHKITQGGYADRRLKGTKKALLLTIRLPCQFAPNYSMNIRRVRQNCRELLGIKRVGDWGLDDILHVVTTGVAPCPDSKMDYSPLMKIKQDKDRRAYG